MSARKTGVLIPDFKVSLLDGNTWHSRAKPPGKMTLLTIYRGMWCPYCKLQLQTLERLQDDFAKRNIATVAMSADTEERARNMATDCGLEKLALGFEIPIEKARELGVFISQQEKPIEMPVFCEPGSFLINNNGIILAAWIASNAFARINPQDILDYTEFLSKHPERAPRGSV